ncbi:diadenylate cyclase CdaA [Zunongwangia sp. F260]|uniref:Diadenylate cyclase n=2 Tax=Autumnicola TaxID=3160927 RepID=A0ABU3CXN7_9FLAO|nr:MULTISPECIES: diadenylate cyclase CdaA [unclassified Zunongwangia]MDT0646747.1 diadenylate cyclase CdaA [Zunongwangia sp. F260]MDT0651120.1 diadenylate cyclase CdaA [Zunongwangia sp. F297]
MNILDLRILDIVDIVFVALLLYYLYKLVRGTVAVNIFLGIVIIYLGWWLTQLLQMELLSNVLGEFIGVGMFALIVVFQQEIRKFLLMIGSTNFTHNNRIFRSWRFSREDDETSTNVEAIVKACEAMGKSLTGALIVIQKSTSLDFVKNSGDDMDIKLNKPILQSIFYKNSTLHDGAIVIEDNKITATRVILPVSNDRSIPLRFGLRHRAAVGITEKTDALALVVSEETGQISYIKDGEFVMFETTDELIEKMKEDLS